jgi:hypothetical protein
MTGYVFWWLFSFQMTEKLVEIIISAKTARKQGARLIHWQNIKIILL